MLFDRIPSFLAREVAPVVLVLMMAVAAFGGPGSAIMGGFADRVDRGPFRPLQELLFLSPTTRAMMK